jgi:hypothetical protein
MPYVVADRVKENSTSIGTGNFTLSGAATGFRTFNSAIGVNNTTTYVISDSTGGQWEVGLGTLTASTTLRREIVFSNSSGGTSFINFSAGAKTVFVSMSAAPRNDNTVLGTSVGFSPDAYQSTTVVGFGASAGADFATAVGRDANASGGSSSAFGRAATASGADSVAIGRSASVGGTNAVGIGYAASASQENSVALGINTNASISNAVVVGPTSTANGTTAPYDKAVVVGATSTTFGGITVGSSSTPGLFSPKSGTTIIGHGITALEDDATYMNKFRTSVTPVGTSWFLKWDDSTNEVYADPGPTPPAGTNWYAYQVQPSPGSTFSVAMPAGMPTGSFGFGNSLFSTQSTFSGSPTPSGAWTYLGTFGPYNSIYAVGSPQPDPEVYSGSAFGVIIIYYRGYETDSGATATVDVNTGTTLYSGFSTDFYCSSFSVFGTTQYGHAIVTMSGNYAGSITASSGATLVEEFYDSGSGNTYAFFDLDSSGVSNASVGMSIATIPSSAGYATIFWYNYV